VGPLPAHPTNDSPRTIGGLSYADYLGGRMPYSRDYFKRHKVIQVVLLKPEAARLAAHAKRHGVSVSGMIRKLVLLILDSQPIKS
jgi:hypothetical protein